MIRVFRHYIPKSLMWLGLAEALVLLFSVYFAVSFAFGNLQVAGQTSQGQGFLLGGLFLSGMLFSMTAVGLYRRSARDSLGGTLLRLTASIVFALLLMAVVHMVLPSPLLGARTLLVAFGSAFAGVTLTRVLFRKFTDLDLLKRNILVVGTGDRASRLAAWSRGPQLAGINIRGYVALPGADLSNCRVPEAQVLRQRPSLADLVAELEVDEIVLALDDRRGNYPTDEILDCKMRGTPVTEVLSFAERETGTIQLDEMRPSNLIFADGFSHVPLKSFEKRAFDLVTSSLLLLLAMPVMLLTALAVWLEAPGQGPVLYRQQRVGKGGRLFHVLKFRSMRVDAEQGGKAQWARQNDPRVTRVGALIRKTRIDELPQLFNVLRGDMSFVGPRPERPEFVEQLATEIPYYHLRHYVKPGITGWAQVCYPYGATVEDAKAKLQYDLYYLKNYSLFLDFTILLQTAQVCLFGQGAR